MYMAFSIHERKKKTAYKVLVGEPDGKRPLGRPRHNRNILKSILKKQDGSVD
jgi:hypothetical protein